ncbi:HSP20-like chaperone [Ilyonectria robusta]|uniref:HSP20-like chaperone n=1 Tax=Ilyonectria robusta TaxID=1079257 RepID=UPI001E8CB60E|nr:HSP20-like chaperone [Ilyonectria robusta]KAH8653903.1 HSP20-like chaperone [Ilyonectria robusta]
MSKLLLYSCRSTLPRTLSRNLKHLVLKPTINQTRKMAFFPRSLADPDTSFTPLFRLLDDFDNYSRQGVSGRRTDMPSWQPKFDVCETGEAYELHGELPGINKEDVHIEFTEPQSMLIRGRTERTYTAGTPPAGLIEGTTRGGAITEGDKESKKASEAGTEAAEKEMSKTKKSDKAKYWLSERSVGEFSRSFNFPTQVDQESVTANFKDGILKILVPKAKKHESKRIAIS